MSNNDFLKERAIDISSAAPYPICELSNFAFHPFVLDGIKINSMEGFLQALKFKSKFIQKCVCLKVGKKAKQLGKYGIRWKAIHQLYWNGNTVNRFSPEYALLLKKAYDSMANSNPDFVKVLLSYSKYQLQHSVGKDNPKKTVLTKTEYLEQLNRLIKKCGGRTEHEQNSSS